MRIAILDSVWHDSKPGGQKKLLLTSSQSHKDAEYRRLCYEYDKMLGGRAGKELLKSCCESISCKSVAYEGMKRREDIEPHSKV